MKHTLKQMVFCLLSMFIVTIACANTKIIMINQNPQDSIQIYYKICSNICKSADSPTPLIKPNSKYEFEIVDTLGSYAQLFATKVVVITADGNHYTKDFKLNELGLNACQSYGNDALLFNAIDNVSTVTCSRTAVAY